MSKWFTVSHPAQTEFKILGGNKPNGADKVAREALDKAKEKRVKNASRGNRRK